MPSKAVEEELKSKEAQKADSRRATFDKLTRKKRAEREVSVTIPGDAGEPEEITLLFRAISSTEYDNLMAKYPPTAKQKVDGSPYDFTKFGPAIVAAVCVEPQMSYEEVKSIWDSPDWSRGEIMTLFSAAVEICNVGLNVPFNGNG